MKSFHAKRRLTNTGPNGQHAIALGLRAGYWPCLRAVFVQAAVGKHTFSVWWGDPETEGEPRAPRLPDHLPGTVITSQTGYCKHGVAWYAMVHHGQDDDSEYIWALLKDTQGKDLDCADHEEDI